MISINVTSDPIVLSFNYSAGLFANLVATGVTMGHDHLVPVAQNRGIQRT